MVFEELLTSQVFGVSVTALAFLAVTLVVSELIVQVLDKVIKPLTSKTKTTLDDRLMEAAHTPIRLLGIILGVYWTIGAAWPGSTWLNRTLEFWLSIAFIAWGGLVISNLLGAFLKWYYRELSAETKKSYGRFAISDDFIPILRRVVKITIYTLTAVIILDRFGVQIAPILAALGIGGLAVALALKDTLANFFAGVYLLTDKPIVRGEFIALDNEDSVIRGFVEEVGWRTTRIRTRGNYTYFVPNEKITLSNVVNFSRGDGDNWKGASLKVGVSYDANPDQVAALLTAAVKRVQKADERMAKDFEPIVRLDDFGDSALVFVVQYRVHNHFEREMVASAVRMQILNDLRKANVDIPFPIRTVRVESPNRAKPRARLKR